jgi:hypothetical protein
MPLKGATLGFAPFEQPVPIPATAWNDAPLVCVQVNETWMTYVLGALFALLPDSTWDSTDPVAVDAVQDNVRAMLAAFSALEACAMAIEFRVNPGDSLHWQYSLDTGATWLDGPATTFPAMPTDLVKTDPAVAGVNIILGAVGVPPLIMEGLGALAALMKSNSTVLELVKWTGGGLLSETADPIVKIDAPNSYAYPLIEVP